MDKKLILVVDDEQYYREIFSAKLIAAGYQVELAENGKQAVEKARALKPALILLDVRMPEMDGIEALVQIKQDPQLKDLKVLFLTSLGGGHDDARNIDDNFAKQAGAEGCMHIDEDLEKLLERVRSLISWYHDW